MVLKRFQILFFFVFTLGASIMLLIFLLTTNNSPLYGSKNSNVIYFDIKNKREYWEVIRPFKRIIFGNNENNFARISKDETVKEKLALIEKITLKLPNGYEVLDIASFREAENDTPKIALLTAKTDKTTPDSYLTNFTNTYLSVFKEVNNRYQKIWISDMLTGSNLAILIVYDITGDGNPDVVVCEVEICGSRSPSHFDVFSDTEYGWHRIFSGSSNEEPGKLRDLNRDGKYEIILNNSIGKLMSHAEQPRWLSIYAYDGKNYILANRRFPNEFKELQRKIKTLILKYPDDSELLYYKKQLQIIFQGN